MSKKKRPIDEIFDRPQTRPEYKPPMTQDEFEAAQVEELQDIPVLFHTAVKNMAWEEGHSSGLENVINCLRSIVIELSDPFKKMKAEREEMVELLVQICERSDSIVVLPTNWLKRANAVLD